MTKMIPENVEEFTTEGEQKTYRFLEAVAKPDARFLCWYLPDVQGREPDFILYSQQNGLIILEVKDWNLNQIREVNPHHFVLDIRGKTVERKNPLNAYTSQGNHGLKEKTATVIFGIPLSNSDLKLFAKRKTDISMRWIFQWVA